MNKRIFLTLLLLLSPFSAKADEAADLAAKLRPANGTAYVRLRMEFGGGSLQIQTKERRSGGSVDIVYQVLFPKERKGEAVLLQKPAGRAPSGSVFTPPDGIRALSASQMGQGIFGSGLAYEDVIDNFFAWPNQTVVGTEEIGKVTCQILESKPGKGDRSSYSSVRSWIDTRRMVPLRVEKYSGGNLACQIDTTNVEKDDQGRHLPASLSVRRAGATSATVIEGSRIRHGVSLSDDDFSPQGLRNMAVPRGE